MTDECPVCKKDCSNPGGLAAHLLFVKDADHQAHRLNGPLLLPATTTPTPPPPTPPAPAAAPAPPPAVAVAPEPRPAVPPPRPVVTFDLPPPVQSGPLLGDGPTTGTTATGGPVPAVEVPLEPIIAGTLALAVNTAFLNRPVDQQLTPTEVGATGFPTAAEACIRLWFPDLPVNHPITALLLSGASLAMLAASYRGKLEPKKDETTTDPTTGGPTTTDPTTETTAPPPGSTGDPYWDLILAQAGGMRRDE
jgi:hypothetical protein